MKISWLTRLHCIVVRLLMGEYTHCEIDNFKLLTSQTADRVHFVGSHLALVHISSVFMNNLSTTLPYKNIESPADSSEPFVPFEQLFYEQWNFQFYWYMYCWLIINPIPSAPPPKILSCSHGEKHTERLLPLVCHKMYRWSFCKDGNMFRQLIGQKTDVLASVELV